MLLALNAKNAKTPFEWFDLFFLNEMIEKIAEYTNGSIQIVLDEFADTTDSTNRNTHFCLVDQIDIKSFLGILYLRAALGLNIPNARNIWTLKAPMIFLLSLCLGTDSTFYTNLLPLMKNQQQTIDGGIISLLA